MPPPDVKRDFVCFASSFAYESAPNITHVTFDGEVTACGRRNWATTEGWSDTLPPDCLVCAKAWRKLGLPTRASVDEDSFEDSVYNDVHRRGP